MLHLQRMDKGKLHPQADDPADTLVLREEGELRYLSSLLRQPPTIFSCPVPYKPSSRGAGDGDWFSTIAPSVCQVSTKCNMADAAQHVSCVT